MTQELRQPTHKEAVEIMLKALTDQQRRANLAFWREKYGNEYADRIAEESNTRHKEKRT